MEVRLAGSATDVSWLFANASPTEVRLAGSVTDVSWFWNAPRGDAPASPTMLRTPLLRRGEAGGQRHRRQLVFRERIRFEGMRLAGSVTDVSWLWANAPCPMDVRLAGSVTDVSWFRFSM